MRTLSYLYNFPVSITWYSTKKCKNQEWSFFSRKNMNVDSQLKEQIF